MALLALPSKRPLIPWRTLIGLVVLLLRSSKWSLLRRQSLVRRTILLARSAKRSVVLGRSLIRYTVRLSVKRTLILGWALVSGLLPGRGALLILIWRQQSSLPPILRTLAQFITGKLPSGELKRRLTGSILVGTAWPLTAGTVIARSWRRPALSLEYPILKVAIDGVHQRGRDNIAYEEAKQSEYKGKTGNGAEYQLSPNRLPALSQSCHRAESHVLDSCGTRSV